MRAQSLFVVQLLLVGALFSLLLLLGILYRIGLRGSVASVNSLARKYFDSNRSLQLIINTPSEFNWFGEKIDRK